MTALPVTALPAPLTAYLTRTGHDTATVVALTPDASDRRYFRVQPAQGPSFIVALHAAPFAPGSLAFTNVASLLSAIEVPAPRVLDEAADLGILALADLGDVTLQSQFDAVGPAERDRLYAEAAALVVRLQAGGRRASSSRFIPFGLAFDVDKLSWEMEFFIKHFLGAYRGVTLPQPTRDALRRELDDVIVELAGEPRVLCHRDYHSRNVMVHDGQLFLIDFQDARMGPNTYDLVSLLRDSYVDIPERLVDAVITRFAHEVASGESVAEFRRRFDLMALQRNLKALGTFGFQATSLANPAYAQYVPRTLRYVRENLDRTPRFARLRDVLSSVLPELCAPSGATTTVSESSS